MKNENETTGQKLTGEVTALLKARSTLLWVVSSEEARVEKSLFAAASAARYPVSFWACVGGITDITGKEINSSVQDPMQCLSLINSDTERRVWVMRDLHQWIKDPTVLRALRNAAKALQTAPTQQARSIIILSPSADVPPDLIDHAIVVKWQLPDRAEIAAVFDTSVAMFEGPDKEAALAVRDAAIEAAIGLTTEAASTCYSKSLVTQGRRIVPSVVAEEKRRVINREKGIEWFDPDPRGLDAVGGLDLLKPWLEQRKCGYTQEARDYGLPLPKGVMLVGVPGCGKSLIAKAIATAFGCPLLRADFGGAQSKWVGESQQNIRAVFSVAEAIGHCVLWVDEIEKALAGATSGAADGGVSSDALGTFLTWMQERKGAVFVIATSNDVSKLPPELLRKGRWDDLFFVDLPTSSERREIVNVSLAKYKRTGAAVDVVKVADECRDFTGSEIDALIPEALFKAFADNKREITTADLVEAAKNTTPLANTAKEKIEELRKWAKGKARPSSKPEETATRSSGRALDI